jgi:hypothetical protein
VEVMYHCAKRAPTSFLPRVRGRIKEGKLRALRVSPVKSSL